jgi:hypothetical protein
MSAIAADSPVGQALQERVLPKLMELGWSSGEQDDTLSEYIILMLANGNNEEQIATELSTDLLNSEPDDPAPANFAKWLFEQVHELQQQLQGGQAVPSGPAGTGVAGDAQIDPSVTGDADMGDGGDGSGPMYVFQRCSPTSQLLTNLLSPTGPKAMRNGTKGPARDKRMIGSINKTLDRSTDPLHRVRGTAGTGRINSHARDPPKGPRQTNIQRNLATAGNGRGMMQNMPMGNPMAQMPYPQQNGGQMVMDGNQMQQMLHMLERQAQMMAQMSNNMQPGQTSNFPNGRPLNDRVERRGRFQGRRQDQPGRAAADTDMGEDGQPKDGEAAGESKEEKGVAETMCR